MLSAEEYLPLVVEDSNHAVLTVQKCRKCGSVALKLGYKINRSPVSANGCYFDYLYWECTPCNVKIRFSPQQLDLVNGYGMYSAKDVIIPDLQIARTEKVGKNADKREEFTFKE